MLNTNELSGPKELNLEQQQRLLKDLSDTRQELADCYEMLKNMIEQASAAILEHANFLEQTVWKNNGHYADLNKIQREADEAWAALNAEQEGI